MASFLRAYTRTSSLSTCFAASSSSLYSRAPLFAFGSCSASTNAAAAKCFRRYLSNDSKHKEARQEEAAAAAASSAVAQQADETTVVGRWKARNTAGLRLLEAGEYGDAVVRFEDAIATIKMESHYLTRTLSMCSSLSNLGACFVKQQHWGQAENVYEHCANLLQEIPSPSTAVMLVNTFKQLALVFESRDPPNLAAARSFFKSASLVCAEHVGSVGELRPLYAEVLFGNGRLAAQEGDVPLAISLIEKSLDVAKQVHGEKNTTVVAIILNLAHLCREEKRWGESKAHYLQASEILQALKDPQMMKVLDRYMLVLQEENAHVAAEQARKEEKRAKNAGKNTPDRSV